MIARLVLAAVIGVVVILVCILVGTLLLSLNVSIAVAVGAFLKEYSSVIGVLAFLYSFFSGPFSLPSR